MMSDLEVALASILRVLHSKNKNSLVWVGDNEEEICFHYDTQ